MSDETHATGDPDVETREVQLIDHALAPMLNEHGAQGWELVAVADDLTATLRRRTHDPVPWEYATVPLIPSARDVILEQWTSMGYELVLERGTVGFFKRPRQAPR